MALATPLPPPELAGPLAWTGAGLKDSDWLVSLDALCLAELEAASAILAANPLPTLRLSPEDFALSHCRRLMARVKAILDGGVGFVILDRLPVAAWGRERAGQLYWLLASMLARPVAQKWDGTMIYDVRDTGKKPGNGIRPDVTNVEQNYHTDNSYNLCPPDYVGLLCLQTAKAGGVSRVVSFLSACNALGRRHPELLARLFQPFWFDRQREHAPDDVKVIAHPLFEWDGRRLTARLSKFQVVNGQKLAGEPLDAAGQAALDALEAVMNDPALAKEFHFQPGQMQFVNNRALGHKRTGFEDWPEPERRRHLLRLWLRDGGRAFYNG
jgi:alpha-ketoglutarate-dependent taurine dioxygenase